MGIVWAPIVYTVYIREFWQLETRISLWGMKISNYSKEPQGIILPLRRGLQCCVSLHGLGFGV